MSNKLVERLALSQTPGNPAYELRRHFDELMAETDPQRLHDDLIAICKPCANYGFSEENLRKMERIASEKLASRNPLFSLQKYIADFVLAADGLAVIH